jgi:diadenylate cyclase
VLSFFALVTVGPVFEVAKRAVEFLIFAFIVAFAVVYQSELKALFMKFTSRFTKGYSEFVSSEDELRLAASEIVKACQNLSKSDTGAIIVIAPSIVPRNLLATGTQVGAVISSGLLESIFNVDTPLHDGAVIIKENRIIAAGCFLPLTSNANIPKELGSRHRAAIGVTEESNVIAIVVSEESGVISVAKHGELKRYMTPDKLLDEIEEAFVLANERKRGKK